MGLAKRIYEVDQTFRNQLGRFVERDPALHLRLELVIEFCQDATDLRGTEMVHTHTRARIHTHIHTNTRAHTYTRNNLFEQQTFTPGV